MAQWTFIQMDRSEIEILLLITEGYLQIFEFDSVNNIRRAPIIKMTQLTFNGVKGKPILIGPCFEILSTQLQ